MTAARSEDQTMVLVAGAVVLGAYLRAAGYRTREGVVVPVVAVADRGARNKTERAALNIVPTGR